MNQIKARVIAITQPVEGVDVGDYSVVFSEIAKESMTNPFLLPFNEPYED